MQNGGEAVINERRGRRPPGIAVVRVVSSLLALASLASFSMTLNCQLSD